ncbi:DNA mismatch repair protein MutS [Marinivivus vitaminiproducens]|uniref:DNA mismatch repair protein MutS n=1 Tax=Marinivivus vitaminiproducens TaxID=3035935 RepID=UPI0027AB8E91|nr:DNA mismatch repair protein MutS [Geminicoccaceae bacterium SCSIO 64248]
MTGRDTGSPMLVQYRALKEAHPGCLLFFRLGDFYEMFFEDAQAAAPALDVALTRRPQSNGVEIPMCGVPAHAVEPYLQKLIRAGFKVAICEQTETPAEARKRGGSKATLQRDVVRVVTPGTLTEDGLLDVRRNNHLAALARVQGRVGLAWLDLSTGTFSTQAIDPADLAGTLAAIEPGELLLPDGVIEAEWAAPVLAEWTERLTPLAQARFDSTTGERRLKTAFGVATLDAFGSFERAELAAAGALLDYVEVTQKGARAFLAPPRRIEAGRTLAIDPASRRNLELLSTLSGERRGSLLAAIDRTVTGAGGRLLAARLASPLADARAIRRRLDRVETLIEHAVLRADLRAALKAVPDLERAVSRLCLGRGGPRDLAAIRQALQQAAVLSDRLSEAAEPLRPLVAPLAGHDALTERLSTHLVDEPPALLREGGFIRPGASAELDEVLALRDDGRQRIIALQTRYQSETGIATLKIRHNNLIGYHIEVGAAHRAKVPAAFVQRQSMANATRFSTAELGELAGALAGAADRAQELERELFDALVEDVRREAARLAVTANALARLDVACGLAELAVEQRLARPEITDDCAFTILQGRHPVVEQALQRDALPFVGNDADLSPDRRLWLLTGPNMAGKSTFLRQNALIAVMAQIGSFVPADHAVIGVVDRLFSRVGAADDLARGRSTFMVEMIETAAILNQAGERSLVILDEIGRGTATYDGLSIAWAVVEHLHDKVRCRGLFATHYHELTALAGRLERLVCRTMMVKEWQGEIRFLHEVGEGGADRSYGVHVARLAGLPRTVLARAEQVLSTLEKGETASAASRLAEDLPLFAALAEPPEPPSPHDTTPTPPPVLARLAEVDPDRLSPREALDVLYELHALQRED